MNLDDFLLTLVNNVHVPGDDREPGEITILGNVDGAEYHIIDVVLDKDGMIKVVMDPKIPVRYPNKD